MADTYLRLSIPSISDVVFPAAGPHTVFLEWPECEADPGPVLSQFQFLLWAETDAAGPFVRPGVASTLTQYQIAGSVGIPSLEIDVPLRGEYRFSARYVNPEQTEPRYNIAIGPSLNSTISRMAVVANVGLGAVLISVVGFIAFSRRRRDRKTASQLAEERAGKFRRWRT